METPILIVDHSNLIERRYADTIISVDNDQMSVHSYIINTRNRQLLKDAIIKKSKKSNLNVFEIKEIDFQVLKRLIIYIYSDNVSFSAMDLLSTIKLAKAAISLGIKRLEEICAVNIQKMLNGDNIYDALTYSHELGVGSIKDICFDYAVLNHDTFFRSPNLKKLDMSLLQQELILNAQKDEKIRSFNVWVPMVLKITAPSTIVEDFKLLYDTMTGADLAIQVKKKVFRCHKAILAHASSKLMEIVENSKSVVNLNEFKVLPIAIPPMLKYLYYLDVNISVEEAVELFVFAIKLKIKALADICEEIIRNGINTNTVLSIINIAYNPMLETRHELQKDLKRECFFFFVSNLSKIQMEPLKDMESKIGMDLLISLQRKVVKCPETTDIARSLVEGEAIESIDTRKSQKDAEAGSLGMANPSSQSDASIRSKEKKKRRDDDKEKKEKQKKDKEDNERDKKQKEKKK